MFSPRSQGWAGRLRLASGVGGPLASCVWGGRAACVWGGGGGNPGKAGCREGKRQDVAPLASRGGDGRMARRGPSVAVVGLVSRDVRSPYPRVDGGQGGAAVSPAPQTPTPRMEPIARSGRQEV